MDSLLLHSPMCGYQFLAFFLVAKKKNGRKAAKKQNKTKKGKKKEKKVSQKQY